MAKQVEAATVPAYKLKKDVSFDELLKDYKQFNADLMALENESDSIRASVLGQNVHDSLVFCGYCSILGSLKTDDCSGLDGDPAVFMDEWIVSMVNYCNNTPLVMSADFKNEIIGEIGEGTISALLTKTNEVCINRLEKERYDTDPLWIMNIMLQAVKAADVMGILPYSLAIKKACTNIDNAIDGKDLMEMFLSSLNN